MKKKIKKFLSAVVPKGILKDRIKLLYYNLLSAPNVSFAIENKGALKVFITCYDGMRFRTIDALYSIAADFNFYRHFHKITEGEVIIDAGANRGNISILFSRLAGSTGKVYAFEPDRYNIAAIRKNLDLNAIENVTIEDSLLWNRNAEIDFYEAGTVGSSAVWLPENEMLVKKRAITIDSWIIENNIEKLDFIKMDIEGAEIEALEGCVATISKFAPDFAIASYHIIDGKPTYIKLEEMFSKMNYTYKTVKFNRHEIITFAGPSTK